MQEKLQRERDRTRSYLDVAGVVLVMVNRDGNVEMLNRYGTKILGYTEAELMGRNWFMTAVPEQVRKQRMDGFQKIIAGKVRDDDYAYVELSYVKTGPRRRSGGEMPRFMKSAGASPVSFPPGN